MLKRILIISVLSFFLWGCDEAPKKIKILYPNWSEGIAMTHLAKVMLEESGYEVEITQLDPGPIYTALAMKNGDIFLDAWLPNTHKDYWDKFGGKLDKIGEAFENGTTGLVVPKYMTEINKIEDLNDSAKLFDGKIIGIGSGSGIHKNTEKAIETYGLKFEQVTSSGAAMVASLRKAYMKKEPIVITGWKPHFKWAQYELKYLEDSKGVYPKDACEIIARKGFREDFPRATKYFENFKMPEDKLYSLMDVINKAGNQKDEAAKKWLIKNKEFVVSWMPAIEE